MTIFIGDARIRRRVADMNNVGKKVWRPKHWEEMWEGIVAMRSQRDADVDRFGAEVLPDPKAEPKTYRYQALIALMLSSQTKDPVTAKCMERLKEHGLNVDRILETSDEKLKELLYGVGFHNRKTEYIKRATQILKEKYDGDVPSTLEELVQLPGVGQKMAKITLAIAYGKVEGISVDTHVHRITNRMQWVRRPTTNPDKTAIELESWVPHELWPELNIMLVGFGQQICLPRSPKCDECKIAKLCPKLGTRGR